MVDDEGEAVVSVASSFEGVTTIEDGRRGASVKPFWMVDIVAVGVARDGVCGGERAGFRFVVGMINDYKL